MSDVEHVHPVGDLIAHEVDTEEPSCICGPEVIPVKREDGSFGWLIKHHALDGREVGSAHG